MEALKTKIVISVILLVSVCLIAPSIGLTVSPIDEKEGVMIDFGYYDVNWVELQLDEGMTGTDVLEMACSSLGYAVERDVYGDISSVNGEVNLISAVWGMYVLRGSGENSSWTKVDNPATYDVGDEKIVSWARTSSSGTMMPAVDCTGYTYYSYAENGKNLFGNPLRIATLAPSVTETLAAVGATEFIVATDKYSNYPKEVTDRQASGDISFVGGYTDPNYELIISASPDIVFLDGSVGEHLSIADKLRKSGVNTVVLYEVVEVADLLKNVWIAASSVGMSEKGNEYNSQLSESIAAICSVADLNGLKTFISLSTSDSPYVGGGGTYANTILSLIGATNVFSNVDSWGIVDREAIYVKQPDAIIIISERDKIENDREYENMLRSLNNMWKDTPAFNGKKIFIFSGESANLLSRPGARLAAAVELIAKVLDPDSFMEADYWDRCPKYFGDDYEQYLKYQGSELLV